VSSPTSDDTATAAISPIVTALANVVEPAPPGAAPALDTVSGLVDGTRTGAPPAPLSAATGPASGLDYDLTQDFPSSAQAPATHDRGLQPAPRADPLDAPGTGEPLNAS
jgi:hypothetical protein